MISPAGTVVVVVVVVDVEVVVVVVVDFAVVVVALAVVVLAGVVLVVALADVVVVSAVVVVVADVVVVSATISISPSIRLIFFVISLPFSSTTITLPHVTGYTPAGQSVGTVYVRTNTFDLSPAVTLNADFVSNAISSSATFATTLAVYPSLSSLTPESLIPPVLSTLTAPSIPATATSVPFTITGS